MSKKIAIRLFPSKVSICLVTLAFVVLKLTGVVSWSWLWVLSPVWIYLGAVLLLSLIVYSFVAILVLLPIKVRMRRDLRNRLDRVD